MTKLFASFGVLLFVGCATHQKPDAAPHASSPAATQPFAPLSPQLAAFRDQLRRADAAAWRRLDMAYLQMEAALGQNVVRDLDYPDFVRQLASPDPDTRANGMCGLAASKSPAAVDHLARALNDEPDPWNRTIAVWCLRSSGRRRAADALLKFLAACRDIDLGRCLDAEGQVKDFRAPFPAAGMEAFKALVSLRGQREMLAGAGWEVFARRASVSIHPEPITVLDLDRLKGRPGEPRSDPAANMRKWVDELRE